MHLWESQYGQHSVPVCCEFTGYNNNSICLGFTAGFTSLNILLPFCILLKLMTDRVAFCFSIYTFLLVRCL